MKALFIILFLTFTMAASTKAQTSTYVDRTIVKDGVDFCKGDSGKRAFRVVLKDEDGNFLNDEDMFLQVWDYASNTVKTYTFVRNVFEGRAYRSEDFEEVQTYAANFVNNTSFTFIRPNGTEGMRDSSPYLPWRPSCGEYVRND